MIKNIVFDVGDVLVDFGYRRYMRDLGFDEETVDFLSENMVVTEFWHELDLGVRDEAEAVETFTKKYPQYKDEIIKFWDQIEFIVEEYTYSEPLVLKLKELGYNVYILSNYPIETAERHWPKFKFLPHTDGHIISGYEKVTKPDEAIYRLLESRFGVDLTESIFVDDRQVNIDAANKLGMTAIRFTGIDDLLERLGEEFGTGKIVL
ncbi:MAG: HAD family phosphatase [Eubacterium sp.]|nr:HAD family phosphatase [Eubacterium sp.]